MSRTPNTNLSLPSPPTARPTSPTTDMPQSSMEAVLLAIQRELEQQREMHRQHSVRIESVLGRITNLENGNPSHLNPPHVARGPFDTPESDEEQMDPNFAIRRRREPNTRGRGRLEEPNTRDIKLTLPTFAGKVDPEAYLDWERRMDYIFECYEYNDRKKIAVAAAQLTDNALAWWDRQVSERLRQHLPMLDNWEDMKYYLKQRYVPPHFHRSLQTRYRNLKQGLRSVEEYFEEFEKLRNRLGLEDTEESFMAQFVDGLQDRIARKVERQSYRRMHELLHLAIQTEFHIKKKAASYTRTYKSNTWNSQVQTGQSTSTDKGKSADKGKGPLVPAGKGNRSEPSRPTPPTKTRDIVCFV